MASSDDDRFKALLPELLQLGAVSGLRALTLLSESREHVEALALAVRLAGLQLGRQTQVLGLSLVLTRT